MLALFSTVFVASLIGSLHCAGMCGGFVVFWAGGDASQGRNRVFAHMAYNGGRLVTYVLLGVLAGALGQALDLAGHSAGLEKLAAALAGGLMVAWGALALLRALQIPIPQMPLPKALQRAYASVLQRLRGKPPVVRAAMIGLASTLLPCGWLYAFAVTAAGTGSWAWGALTMAAFWLGTLPVLVGVGAVVQQMAGPARRHLPAVTALCVMGVGLFALTHRLNVPHIRPMAAPVSLQSAAERAQHLGTGQEKPPCCRDDE